MVTVGDEARDGLQLHCILKSCETTYVHHGQFCVPFLLLELCHCIQSARNVEMSIRIKHILTAPPRTPLIPQKHIGDFHRIALRAVIAPQALPYVLLVDAVHARCQLFDDVVFYTAKALDDLEIDSFRRGDE